MQVYQTPCLVLGDNLDGCDTLINPANPGLTGTSNFSYFPRGGPVPKHTKRWLLLRDVHPIMGYVSRWGDVDVSRGLLLPENVLDGLVHQHAGWRLRAELCFVKRKMAARLSAVVGNTSSTEPCPVGTAVVTSAGALRPKYQWIVHTAPPFFSSEEDPSSIITKENSGERQRLYQCYHNSWRLGFSGSQTARLATPLLGAGCRGFPLNVALSVAVDATTDWLLQHRSAVKTAQEDEEHGADATAVCQETVVFGLLDEDVANNLFLELSRRMNEKP